MEVQVLVFAMLCLECVWTEDNIPHSDRHAVYWNSSNTKFWRGEYTVTVNINDYLDVFCPYYGDLQPAFRMERYILFMVNSDGYANCEHRMHGFKRWECNRPRNADGPLRFSEKFQLFTPFSLGFEFRPGNEYYYISSPHPSHAGKPCLKLKVYVKTADSSLFESPEPFLIDGGVANELHSCALMLSAVVWFLMMMMMRMMRMRV